MTRPTTTSWRVARSTLFAVVAGYLAALGHLLGSGGLPDPAVVVLAGVVIGGSVTGFTRRQRSGPEILAILLIAQLAFHLLFTLTAHHNLTSDQMPLDLGPMVAFHLVAAVLTAGILARGENALFGLYAALTRAVLRILRAGPVTLAPSWTVLARSELRRPAMAVALALMPRRGPPGRN